MIDRNLVALVTSMWNNDVQIIIRAKTLFNGLYRNYIFTHLPTLSKCYFNKVTNVELILTSYNT